MKRTLYIGILLILAFACERENDWDLQHSESFLITDCIITNELKRHELNIYWSADSMNQPVTGFSGASVELADGLGTISFSEDPLISGKYISEVDFRATLGRIYRLVISWEGQSDTAFASMTGVAPLGETNIQPDGEYYKYIFSPTGSGYMLEVYYNWSGVPGYCEQYGSCQALDVFYALDNIDPGKLFAPDRQIIFFPKNTTIIRKKYSLTQEHQDFARSLLLETEWRGGVFDAEAGNVPTNFRNGLRGWFAACMVVSDTTFFK